MVEDEARIIAGRGCPQRTLLSNRNGIDCPGMAIDLTNGVSAIPGEEMAVSLSSVSHGDDALRIAVPCDVIDPAINDRVAALCEAFSDAVPNLDGT